MVVVLQRFENRRFATNLGHPRIQRGLAGSFKKHKLVDQKRGNQRARDAVERGGTLLPALHGLPMGGPKIGGQRVGACVKQVAIVQGFVVLVVVSRQAQRTGFDAHVDVFGHQHHLTRGWLLAVLLAQGIHYAQNLVVRLALRQARRQRVVQRLGLEEQLAFGFAMAGGIELQAHANVGAVAAGQGVQTAAGLARVAGHFSHAFFVAIELFKHDHRQKDVVLFKAEQAHGVVHQDVGVQHEQFCGSAQFTLFRCGGCAGWPLHACAVCRCTFDRCLSVVSAAGRCAQGGCLHRFRSFIGGWNRYLAHWTRRQVIGIGVARRLARNLTRQWVLNVGGGVSFSRLGGGSSRGVKGGLGQEGGTLGRGRWQGH